eukprot:5198420-Heterocapsa_arctica.AAC.1
MLVQHGLTIAASIHRTCTMMDVVYTPRICRCRDPSVSRGCRDDCEECGRISSREGSCSSHTAPSPRACTCLRAG